VLKGRIDWVVSDVCLHKYITKHLSALTKISKQIKFPGLVAFFLDAGCDLGLVICGFGGWESYAALCVKANPFNEHLMTLL
jgi:hypothetical protein